MTLHLCDGCLQPGVVLPEAGKPQLFKVTLHEQAGDRVARELFMCYICYQLFLQRLEELLALQQSGRRTDRKDALKLLHP